MPHHTWSACHGVFNSAELRRFIFSFVNEHKSLAQCAMVCSLWSGSALDALWREMYSIAPLLSLAGLLKPMSPKCVKWTTVEGYLYDQCRFQNYANRIEELILHDLDGFTCNVISELLLKTGKPCLLPNLKNLDSNQADSEALDFVFSLTHEKLENLALSIPSDTHEVSNLLKEVTIRFPGLKSLLLRPSEDETDTKDFESGILESLPKMKSLEVVKLPMNSLTSPIMETLSNLPRLKQIQWEHKDPIFFCTIPDVARFPTLHNGSFILLTRLEISQSFSSVIKLLQFIPNLTGLFLRSWDLETAEMLQRLLMSISCSCRSLVDIMVDAMPIGFNLDFLSYIREGSLHVSPSTFQYLSLPSLAAFTIVWPKPFNFSNIDLALLISRLPSLTDLEFNCYPVVDIGLPKLTLDFLPYIAKLCPRLRSLGLYVNCHVALNRPSEDAYSDDADASGAFQILEVLNLGLSKTPTNPIPLAEYLSRIVPSFCSFTSDREFWCEDVGEQVVSRHGKKYTENKWVTVAERLQETCRTLIKANEEERIITASMEKRIQELEAHVQELENHKKDRITAGMPLIERNLET
ncbi:hypothetical protein DFH11DRAFT_1830669 [Phellopilus nigrolimitatus]|nr:hypothetical protein DFH11DRAFT_1830669 [Phellopilus nigrolimitatus]